MSGVLDRTATEKAGDRAVKYRTDIFAQSTRGHPSTYQPRVRSQCHGGALFTEPAVACNRFRKMTDAMPGRLFC
jgi:hypothetical protein